MVRQTCRINSPSKSFTSSLHKSLIRDYILVISLIRSLALAYLTPCLTTPKSLMISSRPSALTCPSLVLCTIAQVRAIGKSRPVRVSVWRDTSRVQTKRNVNLVQKTGTSEYIISVYAIRLSKLCGVAWILVYLLSITIHIRIRFKYSNIGAKPSKYS